jgi:hypothetical protein
MAAGVRVPSDLSHARTRARAQGVNNLTRKHTESTWRTLLASDCLAAVTKRRFGKTGVWPLPEVALTDSAVVTLLPMALSSLLRHRPLSSLRRFWGQMASGEALAAPGSQKRNHFRREHRNIYRGEISHWCCVVKRNDFSLNLIPVCITLPASS